MVNEAWLFSFGTEHMAVTSMLLRITLKDLFCFIAVSVVFFLSKLMVA